jgi:hypothetical protein
MASSNGNGEQTLGQHVARMSQEFLVNGGPMTMNEGGIWMMRSELLKKFIDPRRDINQECYYPDSLAADVYRGMYDRMAIAERVVQLMPKESWQVTPLIYEDESSTDVTEFEKAWDNLSRKLKGWSDKGSKKGGKNGGKNGDGVRNAGQDGTFPSGSAGVDQAGKRKGKGQSKNGKVQTSWYQDEEGSSIWSWLLRADILSGIGVFGCILLGLNDRKQLYQPADGVPQDGRPRDVTGVSQDIYGGALPVQPLSSTMGTDAQYTGTQFSPMTGDEDDAPDDGEAELTFIRCFDESLVQIVQYEADVRNPRFGMPVMYRITLNDPRQPHTGVGLPLATLMVHWSRVIHLADNLMSSEIFGVPRMRPVLNNILDLRKLYGGSAEMYWRGAFPGMSLETHPQLGGDVDVDYKRTREMMERYWMGLDRELTLMGMSAKTLSPQVVDPTPQINVQIEAICIQMGCPVRVFKGSERGELASSQDDAAWNDRLKHRQQTYLTPKVIVPFVDRLIMLGVLPEPEGYSIEWPDLDSLTDKDKAGIFLQRTQAIAAYVGGNVETLMPPEEFLSREAGFDEEEAAEILESAKKEQEKQQADAADLADEHGMVPTPPPGFQHPPQPPVIAGMPGAGGANGASQPPGKGGPPNPKAPLQPVAPVQGQKPPATKPGMAGGVK